MSTQSNKRSASREDLSPPQPGQAQSTPATASDTPAIPSIEKSPLPPNERISLSVPARPSLPTQFRIPESPRSATGEHANKSAKVAIPRLKKNSGDAFSGKGGRHRVTHACEPCRQRKTKCSGERPVCKHCTDFKIPCYYADGKRDRAKKQFGTMAEKCNGMEGLLRDLANRVGEDDKDLIMRLLEKDMVEIPDNQTEPDSAYSTHRESSSGQESEISARAGSTGAVDRLEEDFNRTEETRAMGFMGKNSDVTWMHAVQEEIQAPADTRDRQSKFDTTGAFSVAESNYHLDDFPVSSLGPVDAYEIPPRGLADNLFNAYMQTVHPSFPIIGRSNFSAQYKQFCNNPQDPKIMQATKWRAIINLIFAIGAKHAHLIQEEWQGDERDHLVYFARARQLSITADMIFTHPDLQLVQIYGLTGFYLLATNQINRSWSITGMAVRAAVALGINLRNDSNLIKDASKEIRYRVWWSLYTLEQHLLIMTGRPTFIQDKMCTAPLPLPFEEDSFTNPNASFLMTTDSQSGSRFPAVDSGSSRSPSTSRSTSASKQAPSSHPTPQSQSRSPSNNPATELEWAKSAQPCLSLYFLHYVQLARIVRMVFDRLYSPNKLGRSWAEVQRTVYRLQRRVDQWKATLPPVFDWARRQRDQAFSDQRLTLGLYYYGLQMIITRPFLCRLDRKMPKQSESSRHFNHNTAVTCVEAAMSSLDLLPEKIDVVGLFKSTAWWAILPQLMQATSILLLELSFRAHHMPEEVSNILQSAKKAVRYLYHMASEDDKAAFRAWKIADSLFRDAATRVGANVDDLPDQLPERPKALPFADTHTMSDYNVSTPITTMTDFQVFPYLMSTGVEQAGYTAYDQYVPYDQSLSGMPTSMPQLSGAEMDFMNDFYHNADPSAYGGHQEQQD